MTRRKYKEFTTEMWDDYLETLEKTGSLQQAARAVGTSIWEARKYRNDVDDFDMLCNVALSEYRDTIRTELHRRALHGTKIPIVGGQFKDQLVKDDAGNVVYNVVQSDRLLELIAKQADPTLKETTKVEVSGGIDLRTSFNYQKLSPEARKLLRALLKQIMKDNEAEREASIGE